MKTNIMRTFIIPMVLVLLVSSCSLTPAQPPIKPTSIQVYETFTLQAFSTPPIPTHTHTPAQTSTPIPINLSDATSVAQATQNPLFDKYCNTGWFRYFFNSKWGVCDTSDKTFVVFNIEEQVWKFSYVDLGLALADEGYEFYTRVIYWTKDENYAYIAPSPVGYDPLGIFYGDGIALLRLNLTNGQIETVLPLTNHFYSISFSPTGRYMVYTVFTKPLDFVVQDLQSGEIKHIKLDEKYDQAGEFTWSDDESKLAYKLIINGDECFRKFAVRLLNISDMSSSSIIEDTQVDTCQPSDPTYYINDVTDNSVGLKQYGNVWTYNIATNQLLLQATATPQP